VATSFLAQIKVSEENAVTKAELNEGEAQLVSATKKTGVKRDATNELEFEVL
jgi:hypothetical protein